MQPTIAREAVFERRASAIHWSAIFAGAAVTIGTWIFLQVLGMGLGLAAVDTDDVGTLRRAGIGTGVWSLIAPILAMFVGGLVASRVSHTLDRGANALHAIMVWAFAIVAGVLATAAVMRALAGPYGPARAPAYAPGAMIIGAAAADRDLEGTFDTKLLGPINERLKAEGRPEITVEQLAAASRDVVDHPLRSGRVDRRELTDRLIDRTELTRAEAEDVARRVDAAFSAREQRGRTTHDRALLDAADRTGKAMVWASLSMLLGLAAAFGGAMLGTYLRRVLGTSEAPRDVPTGPNPTGIIPD